MSPVIPNIYMEYFEEPALGPKYPILCPWWKRVDYVIGILKKTHLDTLHNHFNAVDPHI